MFKLNGKTYRFVVLDAGGSYSHWTNDQAEAEQVSDQKRTEHEAALAAGWGSRPRVEPTFAVLGH